MNAKIQVSQLEIADFCQRWRVRELALFGSALREDFGPESDVDVLVSFGEDVRLTMFDMSRMEEELEAMFGRRVDLISRRGIEMSRNHLRRKAILESAEVIYGAWLGVNSGHHHVGATDTLLC